MRCRPALVNRISGIPPRFYRGRAVSKYRDPFFIVIGTPGTGPNDRKRSSVTLPYEGGLDMIGILLPWLIVVRPDNNGPIFER